MNDDEPTPETSLFYLEDVPVGIDFLMGVQVVLESYTTSIAPDDELYFTEFRFRAV